MALAALVICTIRGIVSDKLPVNILLILFAFAVLVAAMQNGVYV